MSAIGAIGSVAAPSVGHMKPPSAVESAQRIQEKAIAEHHEKPTTGSTSVVDLKV